MSSERLVAAGVAVLLLGAAGWSARRGLGRHGSPIDALTVFLAVWGCVLGLFALPVIDYTATPVAAWALIYGSIAAFAAGCVAADRREARTAQDIPPAEEAATRLIGSASPRRLLWIWAVASLLGLVGFAIYVRTVDRYVGWHAIFDNPEAIRTVRRDNPAFDLTYGPWKLLTYLGQLAVVLWSIALRAGAFRGKLRPLAPLGLVSLVPFAFTADRGVLAALVTWLIFLHALWPRRMQWRRVAAVGLALVLLGGVALTVLGNRYGGSIAEHPELASHVRSHSLRRVAIPYLYLTANMPTFGQLTQDGLAPQTFGQMTALPAVKAAHALAVPGTPPVGTGVFYAIPFEDFSNYTWLGSFWLDFRAPGVILLVAALGFATALARARLRRTPSVTWLLLASLMLYAVAFSPLANAYSTTFTWQFLVLAPIIGWILDPRAAQRARRLMRRAPVAARAALVSVAVLLLGARVALGAPSPSEPPRAPAEVKAELRRAIDDARYVYGIDGRYPAAIGLATRLHVAHPSELYNAASSYHQSLPPIGTVSVVTDERNVYLRALASDGRLYEAHRTEDFGGVTFGPGTRDR